MAYNTEQNTRHSRIWRDKAWTTLVTAMGGKCQLCGYTGQHALDFHHVDPNLKEKTISALIASRSWQRTVKEARKCVLICSNCHREVHAGVKQCPNLQPFDVPDTLGIKIANGHGTNTSYVRKSCRCDQCTKAHAVYEHARRLRGCSVTVSAGAFEAPSV